MQARCSAADCVAKIYAFVESSAPMRNRAFAGKCLHNELGSRPDEIDLFRFQINPRLGAKPQTVP